MHLLVVLELHVASRQRWLSLNIRAHPTLRARVEYGNIIHEGTLAIRVRDLTPDATKHENFPVGHRLYRIHCVRPARYIHLSLLDLRSNEHSAEQKKVDCTGLCSRG